jgi:hypothetical protein
MGKPPVYDRAGLNLSDDDKAVCAPRGARAIGASCWIRNGSNGRTGSWPDLHRRGLVSDPVLIRADGQVLYTFASSVDDVDMGVTDIVRGADHVTNTATQIQIIEALGGAPPAFRPSQPADRRAGRGTVQASGHAGDQGPARKRRRARGAGVDDGASGVVAAGRAAHRWTRSPTASICRNSAPRRRNSTPKTCGR